MRKVFAVLTVLSLMVPTVQAGTPVSSKGDTLQTIDFVGAYGCDIDLSTGANAVQCGSDGRNLVYGIIVSSTASTDYLVLRDSGTANTTSSTETIVFADTDGGDEGASTTIMHRFPVPLRFENGISANASAAPTTQGRWTILYRPE